MKKPLLFLCSFAAAAFAAEQAKPESAPGDQSRGREIIHRFVEVNRYWLLGPPAGVENFSYVLNRLGGSDGSVVLNTDRWVPLEAHVGRLTETFGEYAQVDEGLSTASWKEFQTEWKVKLEDAGGRLLAAGTTNLELRAESGPAPFKIRLDLPRPDALSTSLPQQVAVEAIVQRMTGTYHGHGMWFRFARKE